MNINIVTLFILIGILVLILLIREYLNKSLKDHMFKPIVINENFYKSPSLKSEIFVHEDVKISHIFMINQKYNKFLFYFHGRYGNMYLYNDLIEYLHKAEINVILMDYRGYGKTTGDANISNILLDSKAITEHYINKYNIHYKNITIWGESLGSIPAIYIASQIRIQNLIIYGGISSISDIFKYNDKLAYVSMMYSVLGLYNYSNADKLKNCMAENVLFLHCDQDELINVTCCVNNYKNCCSKNKYIIRLNGCHSKPIFNSRSMTKLKDMLKIKHIHKYNVKDINRIISNIA